ncbi:hypothetical protein QEN19_001995 [Hanseniaspora menglaensis]
MDSYEDGNSDLAELKIPETAFKLFNFHFNNPSNLVGVIPYEPLNWHKILKDYYKINYGDALKLHKDDIKPLTDIYYILTNSDGDGSNYSSYDLLQYIHIITNLHKRIANDKALGYKFAYENSSLNMEILYWIFDLFKNVFTTVSLDSEDNKMKYCLLKESNSVITYLSDNFDSMFKKKLHNLPKVYALETIKFFKQLINAMQQELFVKITIASGSKLNYSLLSKMAYQIFLYYDDNTNVKLFTANRFNNYYTTSDNNKGESLQSDFFIEVSNMITIKKSIWILVAVYYHCLNLYKKNGKHGEPISILKCFLNNYDFNENHEGIASLKKQMIDLLSIITKENDYVFNEEVDTSLNNWKQIIEKSITSLSSNKFVKFEENLDDLNADSALNANIDKMFKHIINMKTLEQESIFTAEKESFCNDKIEIILTENMELVTLVEYNQLDSLYKRKNGDISEPDIYSMHQTISNSDYKDVNVIKKQVDYLRQKAVEMTSNANTDNQIALQRSLKNAIENDIKLFENVKFYKNEINLLKDYDNLSKVYESLKQKNNSQQINLIDYEDNSAKLTDQLKERHAILNEIQYQRNVLMKKFKPNSGTEQEQLNEHNEILKIILSNKEVNKLKKKFNEYISEKYAFETATLNALSKQQTAIANEIEHLVHQLQLENKPTSDTNGNENEEFLQFKQKLSSAVLNFQTYEQNCKECISYYNSLFELIPQHF